MSNAQPEPTLFPSGTTPSVRMSTSAGRWVLGAAVLGSSVAGIDATVVNIALPAIGRDLHGGFQTLQWTVTAYTLTLAALILLGGSCGDRYGRRRVFLFGVVWFAVASLACGLAPTAGWLVAARALQGVGGALLTPASLAIIQASFVPSDRSRAVGAWAGLSGLSVAVAPFLGGWLLAVASWHWVFLINPPVAVVIVAITVRHVPESRDNEATGTLDVTGAALGFLALSALTYAAIRATGDGFGSGIVLGVGAAGVGLFVAFLSWERRAVNPMMPLGIFTSVQFSASNAVTFLVYAALSGFLFLLVVELQVVGGFSPLLAGAALLPMTAFTLLLSERSGMLAQRIGPRLQMSVGPLVCAAGVLMTLALSTNASYLRDVLPALSVFGLGLAIMVAPLTATVLAAVSDARAGIASGVNNAVARTAALLAVATLPAVIGLSGDSYAHPTAFLGAYQEAVWLCAAGMVLGGLLAAVTIRNPRTAGDLQPLPHRGSQCSDLIHV